MELKSHEVYVLPRRVKIFVTLDSGKIRKRLYNFPTRTRTWNDFKKKKKKKLLNPKGEEERERRGKNPQTQVA